MMDVVHKQVTALRRFHPRPWMRPVLLQGLCGVLALASIAFIALFFYIAIVRLNYPLQLEWLEGGILDTAVRVLHHKDIYTQPTYQFVNGLYTPLYYYAGAIAVRLHGPSFSSLRLVSIASTTGCLLVLFLQTRSIARSWFAGLLAAGLFAALYGAVDSWYDLARVDMLYLLLTLLAIFLSYRGHAVWAGLMFVVAYQTKQGAGMVAVFVLLHEVARPRKLVSGVATFFVGTLASILYLDHTTSGWYSYYTLHIMSHQALVPSAFLLFWTRDIFPHLGLALAIIAFGLLFSTWQEPRHRRLCCFLLAGTIGMFVSGFSGRVHSGGAVNALLPVYAWLCLLFGVGAGSLLKASNRRDNSNFSMQVIFLCMGAVQFGQLVYRADKLIPDRHATREAQAVLNRVAEMPGDYLAWNNCIDLTPIGKQTFATSEAVWEILRGDSGPAARALRLSLEQAASSHVYIGVIATGGLETGFPYADAPAQSAAAYAGRSVPLLTAQEAADLVPVVTPPVVPAIVHYPRTMADVR